MALLTQEQYEEKFNNIYSDKFKVSGKYIGGKNKIKITCTRCGAEFERTATNAISRKSLSCPRCDKSGGRLPLTVGINDMNTTHPDRVKFLKNKKDGMRYTYYTHRKLDFICPNCGGKYTSRPADMFGKNGNFRCRYCSDGFSYPEKFMQSVLKQSGLKYIYQFSSKDADWCIGCRYDFCIPDAKVLIETNGLQHYDGNRTFDISLDKQIEIDKNKKLLAENNGYILISIDCRKSELEYIKASILKSNLVNYIDVDTINWKQCGLDAINSKMYEVCKRWNGDVAIVDLLAKKFHITATTVLKYLEEGNKLDICLFDRTCYDQYRKRIHYYNLSRSTGRHIKCVETGEIFNSYADIKRRNNICINKSAIDNLEKTSCGYHWIYTD